MKKYKSSRSRTCRSRSETSSSTYSENAEVETEMSAANGGYGVKEGCNLGGQKVSLDLEL